MRDTEDSSSPEYYVLVRTSSGILVSVDFADIELTRLSSKVSSPFQIALLGQCLHLE